MWRRPKAGRCARRRCRTGAGSCISLPQDLSTNEGIKSFVERFLTHLAVELSVGDGKVEIEASAEITAQTGVEMEALVAATVAALTVYDMAKGVDSGMEIGEVRLLEKVKE